MSITLRKAKSILQKARLLDQVELGGRGRDWSIECPNDRIEKKVSKAFKAQGINLGGYRTGYGAWVLKPDYQSKGDWGDPSSRHHYASEVLGHYGIEKTSGRAVTKKVTFQTMRKRQTVTVTGTADAVRDAEGHLVSFREQADKYHDAMSQLYDCQDDY